MFCKKPNGAVISRAAVERCYMSTAAYRNPPSPESENSAATLNSRAPKLPLEIRQERAPRKSKFTALKVCRDLEALCAMGLLEAYRQPFDGIVRYRPTGGRIV